MSRGDTLFSSLINQLKQDMTQIGIHQEFDLEIRPYSKRLYGQYLIKSNKVVLYYYRDSSKSKPYLYKELLLTAVHEAVHAIQWNDPLFIRCKGVMHDADFYRMCSVYSDRASALCLLRDISDNTLKEVS